MCASVIGLSLQQADALFPIVWAPLKTWTDATSDKEREGWGRKRNPQKPFLTEVTARTTESSDVIGVCRQVSLGSYRACRHARRAPLRMCGCCLM
jgi:hypothetical protein